MDSLFRDLRYGARMLLRKPGITLLALITLALGIGATTATFTIVDAVLLRKLPVSEPDRLVVVHNQLPKLNLPRTQVSAPQYVDYSRQPNVFESTAAITARNSNLTGSGVPERVQAGRVTASFFPTLGVNPLAGRFFSDEDDKVGNEHVVVLGAAMWQRLYSSSGALLTSSIQLNGDNYRVIGVAPAGLAEMYPNVDLWIPMAFTARELSEERRGSLSFTMIGRLKRGTGIQQGQSIISGLARTISGNHPDEFNIELRSITDEYVSDVRKPLLILFCAVAAVLLISCANVANLQLTRASVRSHEIAVRAALGAGRNRIAQQLLTESVLLAIVGGALGIFVAFWATRGLLSLAPGTLPRLNAVSLDFRVLLFSIAISLACGVSFGLVPSLSGSRLNLVDSLKDSERTESSGIARQRLRRIFVVAEVALALMLLVSAGLLIRSFGKLVNVRPGFDAHNVLTLRLSLPGSEYNNAQKIAGFYDSVLPRIAGLPGVQHTAAAFQTPFTPGGDNSVFQIRGWQATGNEPPPHADYAFVSHDYFKTMGLAILRGRGFEPGDMRAGNYFAPNSVAIVDEELAKRFWPSGDVLGAGISWSHEGPWATVVGVCATAQLKDLAEESKGTFYLPSYFQSSTLVVRTTGDPRALAQAIREQVLAVDKNQPVYDIKTMDQRIGLTLETRRFAVVLLGVFGGLALLLAAIGLYGVLAFTVSQRTREIGIHMALGAHARDVLFVVIRQGMTLVGLGAAIGLIGAFAATRLMQSLLFGVRATDLVTFAVVTPILGIVGFVACYIPARRATKVDPLVALRYE